MFDDVFGPKKRLTGSQIGVPFSAVVTQSDTNGVWCTRQGEDSRNSLGPVQNPTRDVVRLTANGHYHEQENLPVGLPVVLVNTESGLWVIARGG